MANFQTSPSISCVVPTHGRANLLARALTSIASQTLSPLEVIVSDDLGEEETAETVRHQRIDLGCIYLDSSAKSTGTAGSSRNLGAAASTGEVLAFLDDDDQWDSNYLQTMVDTMQRENADFVVSWGRLQIEDVIIDANWKIEAGRSFKDALTVNPGFTGSNFIVTREAFDRVRGFDPSLRVYNDLDFFVRLLDSNARYAVVPQSLVTQMGDGAGHLSSRGKRRAQGILAYRRKWASRLTFSDRRRLIRDTLVALNYSGRPPIPKAILIGAIALTSSRTDLLYSARRRLNREPRNYA